MEIRSLKTEPRTDKGSADARRARREGKVPAILYGLGKTPQACLLDRRAFEHELHLGNKTFKLAVDGGSQAALLQDIQYDSLGAQIVHVDFKRIDLAVKVKVFVSLTFVGHPEVTAGAILDHVSGEVHVECLPTAIPKSLDVSVAGLKVGEHVEAKDVKMPEGVTLADDPHKTIASYHYKHVEVEAAPAEPGAEAAEPVVLTEKKPAEGEAPAEKGAGEKPAKAEKPEKK